MEILLGVCFLIVAAAIYVFVTYLDVILIVSLIAIILTLIIYAICIALEDKRLEKVVKATVIRRDPILKTISEKTGHTSSYGYYYTYHEHYQDRDVIVGYKVLVSIEFEDGKKDCITCKEGSRTYKKLIHKK